MAQGEREIELAAGRAMLSHGPTTGKVKVASADEDAVKAIREITDAVGLAVGFEVLAAPAVPNARAVLTVDNKPVILFNPHWMEGLKQRTSTYWAKVSVLAHEVGHHMGFHLLPGKSSHAVELEADYFSGFVLGRLGAPLNEATAAMRDIALTSPTESHPVLIERVAAMSAGWRRATERRPQGRPAAAPPPPSANGAPLPEMVKQADTFFEGEGYAKYVVPGYEQCAALCAGDARCIAAEFYKPAGHCNVYERVPTTAASGDADLAFKRLAVPPELPKATPEPGVATAPPAGTPAPPAEPVTATASAPAPAPAPAVPRTDAPLWDHNRSNMILVTEGTSWRFLYEEPREGMRSRGVTRGTLLFEGVREGLLLSGTTRIFRGSPCGNFTYHASGTVSADERIVVLIADKPIVDESCNVVTKEKERLVFTRK